MKIQPKLTQTSQLTLKADAVPEPPITDKLRVQYLEIVDVEGDTVASIGTPDGLYDKEEARDILHIFDADGEQILSFGHTEKGGDITVSGKDWDDRIRLYVDSDGDGRIIVTGNNWSNRIDLYPTRDGVTINVRGKDDGSINLRINADQGIITIRGEHEDIKTEKIIFKRGS